MAYIHEVFNFFLAGFDFGFLVTVEQSDQELTFEKIALLIDLIDKPAILKDI